MEYVNADEEGKEQLLLHLGDGRVFEVDEYEYSPSGLKRYPLQDMVFSRRNCSLRLKNGTTYYFGYSGRLIRIEDRYENEITFTYGSGSSSDRIAEIKDTIGRRICFDYSNPNKVVLTVRDQGGASQGTIEYHLQDVASGYPPAKKLTKVVDNLGREISFDYDLIEAQFCYDQPDYPATNYYLALTQVTHPFGSTGNKGTTQYTWESPLPRKAWIDPYWGPSDYDYQEYLRIASRMDHDGTSNFNVAQFSYSPYSSNGSTTERTLVSNDIGNLVERMEFDKDYLMVKHEMTWEDPVTLGDINQTREISYFNKCYPKRETISFGSTAEKLIKEYTYDDYGNLLYQFDNSGKRSEYTYNTAHYHLPLEQRTKITDVQDNQSTWYRTLFQLTQDKRNIQSEMHQEYQKTLYPAQTFPGTSSPYMRVDEWLLSKENVTQFKVNVSWSAASWSTMRYTVEYREVGAEEWTRHTQKSKNEWWGRSSGTESYTINLSHKGNWEVRVVASCTGDSRVQVTSSCYVADEIIWTLVGRQVEYLYQYQDTAGPLSANLISQTVVMEDGTHHLTGIDYDQYNAYPSRIFRVQNGVLSPYETTATYDFFGRMKTLTETESGISFTQEFGYDQLGRLTQVKEPFILEDNAQYYRQWEYHDDVPEVQTKILDDTGTIYDQATYRFDPLGRLVSEERIIDGISTQLRQIAYNDRGMVQREEVASDIPLVITYRYDAIGRPWRTILGETESAPRNYTEHRYMDNELEQEVIDTNSNSVILEYDLAGRLIRTSQNVTEILNGTKEYVTEYQYDLLDRLLEVKGPEGLITRYYYELLGISRIEMPVAEGGISQLADQVFTYDNRGNLSAVNYGNGTTEHKYDAWDRSIETLYPASFYNGDPVSPAQKLITTYGLVEDLVNGRQVTVRTFEGPGYGTLVAEVISRTDPLGRLRSELWQIPVGGGLESYSLAYTYDGAGNLTQLTYPDHNSIAYTYETSATSPQPSFGRLQSVPGVCNFTYTTSGFLKSLAYVNGALTQIQPDHRSRPASIVTTLQGQTLFDEYYTYDYENNITDIDENRPAYRYYNYDELNRLTGVTDYRYGLWENYQYDGAGNRTKIGQYLVDTYPPMDVVHEYDYQYETTGNALLSRTTENGTETFTYNSMGGMETRQQGEELTTYFYDSVGRLKEVRTGENIQARYEYDGYGRLVKTEDGKTTIRLPFGNETAYEKVIEQGNPTIERKYIIALGRYLARDERTGQGSWQRTYYHQDHLGSTRALSGTDSGTIAYEPFGSLLHEAGTTGEHKHRFTGKPIDGTGLYYYGARFYDPELGRFISVDPARDGLNWYVYVHNNPLKYVDPTGMWGSDVHNRDDEKRIGTYYWA
ncbi:MAG: RHS repeat-associated core domain-containing protein, partial [Limnochordia bacterium]